MNIPELRQTDRQSGSQRGCVQSHPYQASTQLMTRKMLAAVLAGSFWIPMLAFAEDDQMGTMPTPAPMQSPLAGQMSTDVIAGKLAELQNQLLRVEAMLHERDPHLKNDQSHGMQGNMNAESAPAADKMEAKKMKMGDRMPQQAAKEMKQMPMEPEKMGMMGMGPTDLMKESALPGFPGTSHLYHIGATGFFLDHSEHIALTAEQQNFLNQIKQRLTLAKDTAKRKIDEGEQELWQLTSADQPDVGKIEAKISEIEKLKGEERLAFIRSVGEAAKVLTEEQRKSLTGFAPPAPGPNSMPAPTPAASMPAPTPASSPMPDGMKDM